VPGAPFGTFSPPITFTLTGAAEQPASSLGGRYCLVRARAANAAKVYVGADANVASTAGYELSAGEATGWMPIEAKQVWIKGTAADKVDVLAVS